MEFRPFIVSALLLGLLAMAVISAGIMLADDNNASQSIANDTSIKGYADSLQESLEDTSDSANKADKSFRDSTVSITSGVIFVDAIGGLWKTLTVVPSTVLTLTKEQIKENILGDTAFYAVIGVISLIIVITLILAVWKLVGTGEGG